MNHPTEEQLILYHYGEVADPQKVSNHLDACESCRARFSTLQRTLGLMEMLPTPELAENYGAEVWQRLHPQFTTRRESIGIHSRAIKCLAEWARSGVRRWAVAGGMAALVLAAFLAGRSWQPSASVPRLSVARATTPASTQARERILLQEIGDHLERSQVALIELIHTKTNGVVDISLEQSLARQLVDANRLYRLAATRQGDAGMAAVLEDLEHTLIEIADGPSRLSPPQFAQLRHRLDTDDMLFKVKVIDAQVRAKELQTARNLAGKRS